MKINFPENINLAHPERYILTIYIHPEKFSFSLYNPVDDGSYFYYEIENGQTDAFSAFKEMLFENEWFSLPFRRVYIINNTSAFTYIPTLIYRDKDKKDYMKFLFSENNGRILSHSLQIAEVTILHQLPENIYEFFQRSFVNAEFIHHTASLIAYFQERSKTVNANKMIVNKNGNGLDILCFSRGKFLLGNHFTCNRPEDALYYILFTWKQLDFNQQEDFIYLAGDISSKKELLEKLKLYIHNIIPVNIVPEEHFDRIDTNAIPFELAALSLCEL